MAGRVQGAWPRMHLHGMHQLIDDAQCGRVHPDGALGVLDRERLVAAFRPPFVTDVNCDRTIRISRSQQRLALWENGVVAVINILFAHLRLRNARNVIALGPFT
jgi:hypothetical protein